MEAMRAPLDAPRLEWTASPSSVPRGPCDVPGPRRREARGWRSAKAAGRVTDRSCCRRNDEGAHAGYATNPGPRVRAGRRRGRRHHRIGFGRSSSEFAGAESRAAARGSVDHRVRAIGVPRAGRRDGEAHRRHAAAPRARSHTGNARVFLAATGSCMVRHHAIGLAARRAGGPLVARPRGTGAGGLRFGAATRIGQRVAAGTRRGRRSGARRAGGLTSGRPRAGARCRAARRAHPHRRPEQAL